MQPFPAPKRSRSVTIVLPVFDGCTLHLVHCADVAKCAKRLGLANWEAFRSSAAFVTHDLNDLTHIYMILGPTTNIYTVIHESTHVVWRIFKYHGIERTEEHMAYFHELTVRCVMKAMGWEEKAKKTAPQL